MCTYVCIADSYGFYQTVTAVQRSRVSQWEKTQQHNNSTTLHPLWWLLSCFFRPLPHSAFILSSSVFPLCLPQTLYQQSLLWMRLTTSSCWCNQSRGKWEGRLWPVCGIDGILIRSHSIGWHIIPSDLSLRSINTCSQYKTC